MGKIFWTFYLCFLQMWLGGIASSLLTLLIVSTVIGLELTMAPDSSNKVFNFYHVIYGFRVNLNQANLINLATFSSVCWWNKWLWVRVQSLNGNIILLIQVHAVFLKEMRASKWNFSFTYFTHSSYETPKRKSSKGSKYCSWWWLY